MKKDKANKLATLLTCLRIWEAGCCFVGFCLFVGLFYPATQSTGLETAVLISLLVTLCLCCCCCGGLVWVGFGPEVIMIGLAASFVSITLAMALLCAWPLARGSVWWGALLMFLGILIVMGVLSYFVYMGILVIGITVGMSEAVQEFTHSKDKEMSELLGAGTVRLLSCEWLLETDKLLRCQDLPSEALLTPEDARQCFEAERVLVLSYGWLKEGVPDPHGARLRAVQQYLKNSRISPSAGLFWDFASLPQGDDKTEAQTATFITGLENISSLYASKKSTVLVLKEIPEPPADEPGYKRTPYEQRAWCVCEYTLAGFAAYYAKKRELVQEISSDPDVKIPELTAPDMRAAKEAVENASFTCGKDHQDKVMKQLQEYKDVLENKSGARPEPTQV